jgi:hypothetical protein
VFIHLGLQDILDRRSTRDIMCDVENIMMYLLEQTKANICFSLIIPTNNSEPLNSKIIDVNTAVKELVSELRAENRLHRGCLFTYSNDSVKYHFKKLQSDIKLTELGKNVMWKRLNDGFRKTLRLPRHQLSPSSSSTSNQPSNSNASSSNNRNNTSNG